MGNRVTIELFDNTNRFTDNHLLIYGHWSGTDALKAVQDTLFKTDRIGDPSYLAAQIFHEFTISGGYDGKLGFGLSVGTNTDSWDDNPTVFVNLDTGEYSNGGDVWYDRYGKQI